MNTTQTTAKRVATVYYVVRNGEQVAEAKRVNEGRDKFAEIVAEDTTSHIVLTTAKGKVIDERPAPEVETEETINIPGLGEVSKAGVDALAAGAERPISPRLAAIPGLTKALNPTEDEDDEDALALLGDALNEDEDDDEDSADAEADAEGRMEAPVGPAAEIAQALGVPVETVVAAAEAATAKTAKKTAAKPEATGDVKISTYADMIGIFTAAVAKHEMGAGSLAGYKAGVRAVLKAQQTGLETDLTKVDVEMAVAIFEAKTPGILTQTSKTYIADFRRAVTLYNLYLADPKNFKFPAKNVRATRLVAPAAPVATPAPTAKKTAAKVPARNTKGAKNAKRGGKK
jgi:hypothetical protein